MAFRLSCPGLTGSSEQLFECPAIYTEQFEIGSATFHSTIVPKGFVSKKLEANASRMIIQMLERCCF